MDSSGRSPSEFPSRLAQISVATIWRLRLSLPSGGLLSHPSPPLPKTTPPKQSLPRLRVGFLGAPGWRQRAEVGEIPSKSNERPQPMKSTPLFNILTIMQTGISRLLLNSIKLEDEDNAEREHAVNTAWTTSQGAWSGRRSLEEGAGAHGTLGRH